MKEIIGVKKMVVAVLTDNEKISRSAAIGWIEIVIHFIWGVWDG